MSLGKVHPICYIRSQPLRSSHRPMAKGHKLLSQDAKKVKVELGVTLNWASLGYFSSFGSLLVQFTPCAPLCGFDRKRLLVGRALKYSF